MFILKKGIELKCGSLEEAEGSPKRSQFQVWNSFQNEDRQFSFATFLSWIKKSRVNNRILLFFLK
jgi:hypothetical protein